MTLRELEALHSNGPISQMIEKNFQNPLRASLRSIDAALLCKVKVLLFEVSKRINGRKFLISQSFLLFGVEASVGDDLSPLKTLLGHHPSYPL